MARYADAAHVTKSADKVFDTVLHPGAIVPHSGIYRCTGCGHEAALNQGNPATTQNHRQHEGTLLTTTPIRWQLLVATDSTTHIGTLLAAALGRAR